MIRIAFVINSIHPGGPSYVVRNIISGLDCNKFEAVLITLFDENDDAVVREIKSQNVSVFEMKFVGRMYALTRGQKAFNGLISKERIDVIHSHGFIPDILSARVMNHSIKRISTLHNNMFYDYAETYGDIKGKIYAWTHLHYLKKIDNCVACSQYVMDSMERYLNNLVLVRNGIGKTAVKHYISRSELGIPESAIVFIYVGQFRTRKNSIWMIENFKNNHKENEYLLLLGRGPDAKNCEAIKDKNIKFLGFSDDPYSYMRISDIYISASFAEGFSISILEAMDNGLALFLSDIPSHKEVQYVVGNLYIGEFFNPNSEESFSVNMEEIRKHYCELNKLQIINVKDRELSDIKMNQEYAVLYAY